MMARLAFALALVCAAGSPVAAGDVHTDPREVHACLPLGDDGDILAATRGGLIRVGPSQRASAVWTSLDGLPGTRTDALLRDGDDLWVGTEGGVARVRVDGNALTVDASFASEPVRAIARHGDRLFVATWGGGVHRIDGETLRSVELPGAANERARVSDLATHAGSLYAATAGHGVFVLVDGSFQAVDAGLEDTIVWSLHSDGDDLLIGTVDGMYRHSETGTRRLGNGDIRDINALGGEIVTAGFGSGFRRVDDRLLRRADGLPGDELFPHTIGAIDGLECIGTHYGLWTRRGTSSWKRALLEGPPSNDITDVAADGDRLFVATFDQGLAVLKNGTWQQIDDERIDPNINAIDFDGKRLWVATSAGLSIIDDEGKARLTKREGLPSRHVLSVAALRDGGALVGTTRGAAIVADGRAKALEGDRDMMRANVWAVAEDSSGVLWLGTTRGLYRGTVGGDWKRFSTSTGDLRDDWVTAIAVDGTTAYAGTYKGGVTRIDDGETVTQLGDAWVNPNGLAVHDGTLYASTMDGLFIGDGTNPDWTKSIPAPGIDTTGVHATSNGLIVTSRRGMTTL